MVRALAKPYMHTPLRLVPKGGLRMADFQEYLAIPKVGAVAGGFVCERALIEAGMWEDIEAQVLLCHRKVQAVLGAYPKGLEDEQLPPSEVGQIYH